VHPYPGHERVAVASARPKSTGRTSATADRILDTAERLLQTRGYNCVSYADIGAKLGITNACIHHHFATKAALGAALVERYTTRFFTALTAIESESARPIERLRKFSELYEQVLESDRLCLCGMLAAEFYTLPAAMQAHIRKYFDMAEQWLERTLAAGRADCTLDLRGSDREIAQMLLGAIEGAMLAAWPFRGSRRFRTSADHLLLSLQQQL
jgi:TetR/AcrR family transcriptional regulator, transcriptional repressor for nem operon